MVHIDLALSAVLAVALASPAAVPRDPERSSPTPEPSGTEDILGATACAQELPAAHTDILELTDESRGLPASGSWQLGGTLADLDGDGRPELVLPPPRLSGELPAVFTLGKAGWRQLEVRWPPGIRLAYGDVKAADFDGDGTLDLAFAPHFLPPCLLFGSPSLGFLRTLELPRIDSGVTSRSLATADFDGDGRPDVAMLAEIDLELASQRLVRRGLVVVDLNRPQGWEAVDVPVAVFGDRIATGDVDGDGRPDLLLSRHRADLAPVVLLNRGGGRRWDPAGSVTCSDRAFVFAGAIAAPGSGHVEIAVSRPTGGDRSAAWVHAVVDCAEGEGKATNEAIFRRCGGPLGRLATLVADDLDGDGRSDLVAVPAEGPAVILLRRDSGWVGELSPEIETPGERISGVVTGTIDGNLLLVLLRARSGASPGGVRAFAVHRKRAAAGIR